MKLSTKPNLIYNKNKETIKFEFIYPIKTHHKNIHYVRLLDYILSTTSNEYKDTILLAQEKKQKLLISNEMYLITCGKTSFIVYTFTIPRKNILKDYNIEETFKLGLSLLTNPFIENNKFNEEKFNYEKDYFVEKNKRIMDNIISKMNESFFMLIDKKEELGVSYTKSSIELDKITPSKLYKFYKKNIKNNKCLTYVYGNIDEKTLNKLYNNKVKNIKFKIKDYQPVSNNKNINVIKDIPLEQSHIYLEYKVKNFKKEDIDYLDIIVQFLENTSTDLLFKKLRIEKNIVYSFSVIKYTNSGIFIIRAGIDKKNKTDFINSCTDVLNELKNINNIKKYLNCLIEGLKIYLLKEEDNEDYILNNKISDDLGFDNAKKLLNKYNNCDINKIYELLKKIELQNIVFFRSTK